MARGVFLRRRSVYLDVSVRKNLHVSGAALARVVGEAIEGHADVGEATGDMVAHEIAVTLVDVAVRSTANSCVAVDLDRQTKLVVAYGLAGWIDTTLKQRIFGEGWCGEQKSEGSENKCAHPNLLRMRRVNSEENLAINLQKVDRGRKNAKKRVFSEALEEWPSGLWHLS